jgi:FAD/FMN-containing dehydrogenase
VLLCAAAASAALVVVDPASPAFPGAAAEWNAAPYLAGGAPMARCVAFAHTAADVVEALQRAGAGADANATVRVQARAGRHSYTAVAATTFNATVVDVSNISAVGRVHPTPAGHFHVHVGIGARLFAVYDALAQQGYLFPGGSCPTVGVAGFTLGGGIGVWGRKLGLGADSLVGAQIAMVDAAGGASLVDAGDATHPALMYALRGAGNNNFGVVTRLTLRVYPAPARVAVWTVKYPRASCEARVWPLFEATLAALPPAAFLKLDLFRSGCTLLAVGQGLNASELLAAVGAPAFAAIAGAAAEAPTVTGLIEAVAALGGCGTPAQCRAKVRTEQPSAAKPGQWAALSAFVFRPAARTPGGMAGVYAALRAPLPAGVGFFPMVLMDGLGGNIASAPLPAAFAHRAALYCCQIILYGDAAAHPAAARRWTLGVLAAIDAASNGNATAGGPSWRVGSYKNYDAAWTPDAAVRYYGAGLPRLRRLAARYDPRGVFRYAQGLWAKP